MSQWNHDLLAPRLSALQEAPGLPPGFAQNLLGHIQKLDDFELSRLNPHTLARELGAPVPVVLDTLLHGVKAGVFDFKYNLLCPMCGGLEHNHRRLDHLPEKDFHCTSCDMSVGSDLDNQVEVAFSVNPALVALDLDWTKDPMGWRKYYYSPNYQISPELLTFMGRVQAIGTGALEAGGDWSLSFTATEGPVRMVAMELHSPGNLMVEGEPHHGDLIVDIDLTRDGFAPPTRVLTPGPVTLRLHNRSGQAVGIGVIRVNQAKYKEIKEKHPTVILPFLTAKDLLNHQTFRDLFKVQELDPNLKLHLKSLTLLFTDLKGSTEMYDRAGDVTAYAIVQEHFDLLTEVVRRHGGAVIKTMGDAIMAAFNDPLTGVKAAFDMRQAMAQKAPQWQAQGHEVGLKVGLHEGSALAVNSDDRLDYFGQNVNIAARVQGLSSAGEIWMTQSIARSPGVKELLAQGKERPKSHQALLKGVADPVTVFQISAPADLRVSRKSQGKKRLRSKAATRTSKPVAKKTLAKGAKARWQKPGPSRPKSGVKAV